MRNWLHLQWHLLSVMVVLSMIGCVSSFQPRPLAEVPFQERAQTQTEDNVRVTASVLSADETEAVFGVALYKRGIQPIWLEIENQDDKPTWFLPFSVDPDYFSPLEVTYPYHRTFDQTYNNQIDRYFLDNAMGLFLAPGSTRSGFVFTNLDLGTKSFNVDLVGDDNLAKTFTFFISVPGLRADHQDVDFDNLYSAAEVKTYDESDFKEALKNLPCCTMNEDGSQQDLPINVIIVAGDNDLLQVLIRAGWSETATIKESVSLEASLSIDYPQIYRYAPVVPLHYYGRFQDASFRETRVSDFERNQLRLWLSPMRIDEKEVWIGQITREYGESSSSKKSQKIDMDEARSFLLQNLWYAQGVEKYGFVESPGVAAPLSKPRTTFSGVTYVTDGYRAVLWISGDPVPLSDVEVMDWEIPPEW
ncbi:MAG: LssY C-terminal domain-containing protein [Desulfobacterales bacterium]|jgi:hypothetical protein